MPQDRQNPCPPNRLPSPTPRTSPMKLLPFASSLFLACTAAQLAVAQEVHIQTSLGEIDVALDAVHAPKAVANFLRYTREGHFDGTMIYRVVPGFVLQMGS